MMLQNRHQRQIMDFNTQTVYFFTTTPFTKP